MATAKKFDIENPTDEMIDSLEASLPGEEGFHVTKLSERDSQLFLELMRNPPQAGDEIKKTIAAAKRMLIIRR